MRLIFCFIFPPVAVAMHGKPFSAFFNLILCIFGWVPGVVHALAVNGQAHEKRQTKQIVRAVRGKKPRRRKPCPVHREDQVRTTSTGAYNDPTVGEGGTVFKRK